MSALRRAAVSVLAFVVRLWPAKRRCARPGCDDGTVTIAPPLCRSTNDMYQESCPECLGTGYAVDQADGEHEADPCGCIACVSHREAEANR